MQVILWVPRQDAGFSVLVVDSIVLGSCWEGNFYVSYFSATIKKKEYYTGKKSLLLSMTYNCFVATTNIMLNKKKSF